MKTCSRCGRSFWSSPTGGRPRSRCNDCRSNHDRIDGTRWRKLRRQVLAGAPVCAWPGCGRLATQVDHVIPLAAGVDPYSLENLQALCGPHNASKGARMGYVEAPGVTRLQW